MSPGLQSNQQKAPWQSRPKPMLRGASHAQNRILGLAKIIQTAAKAPQAGRSWDLPPTSARCLSPW